MEQYQVLVIFIIILSSIKVISHTYFRLGMPKFLAYIFTRELYHFYKKREMISGDIAFLYFRGKWTEITILYVNKEDNTVHLMFNDKQLNDMYAFKSFPLTRISLPEALGKAGKVLYAEKE